MEYKLSPFYINFPPFCLGLTVGFLFFSSGWLSVLHHCPVYSGVMMFLGDYISPLSPSSRVILAIPGPFLLHTNFEVSLSYSMESLMGTGTVILLCLRLLWKNTSRYWVSLCTDVVFALGLGSSLMPFSTLHKNISMQVLHILCQIHTPLLFEWYYFSFLSLVKKWYWLLYVDCLVSYFDKLWFF